MSNIGDTQVVTGEVRLSYVNLFEPKKFKESDAEGKYSVTILVPKTDTKTINNIKAAIQKAAEKGAQRHFGGRVPTNVANTFKDGDTEVDDLGELKCNSNPELKDHYYMRLATKIRPIVLDENRNEIINPLDIYSGCYGRVSLTCFAYSGDGKRGVSAVLNNVMKTRDGDPLTSRLTGDEFSD